MNMDLDFGTANDWAYECDHKQGCTSMKVHNYKVGIEQEYSGFVSILIQCFCNDK